MSYPYHSTRTGGGGGRWNSPPEFFFRTSLASVESIGSSQQVEAYFMGGAADGSL